MNLYAVAKQIVSGNMVNSLVIESEEEAIKLGNALYQELFQVVDEDDSDELDNQVNHLFDWLISNQVSKPICSVIFKQLLSKTIHSPQIRLALIGSDKWVHFLS